MEAVITQELEVFTQKMKCGVEGYKGIVKFADNFSFSLVNILWSFIVGADYTLNESKLQGLLDANEQVVQTIQFNNLIVAYPGIRKLFPNVTGFKRQMNAFTAQQNLFRVKWSIRPEFYSHVKCNSKIPSYKSGTYIFSQK